jgi:hypothetical protein
MRAHCDSDSETIDLRPQTSDRRAKKARDDAEKKSKSSIEGETLPYLKWRGVNFCLLKV